MIVIITGISILISTIATDAFFQFFVLRITMLTLKPSLGRLFWPSKASKIKA